MTIERKIEWGDVEYSRGELFIDNSAVCVEYTIFEYAVCISHDPYDVCCMSQVLIYTNMHI